MVDLLSLAILFIVIAIIFTLLGWFGKIAWKIAKWLIIIFIILAILSLIF